MLFSVADDVVERVGHLAEIAVGAAEEGAGEIVDRLRAASDCSRRIESTSIQISRPSL
jgi:hypothetical protein